jgi:hypothetical protein
LQQRKHVVSHALHQILVKRRVGLEAAGTRFEVKEGADGAKDTVSVREDGAEAREICIKRGGEALKAAGKIFLEHLEDFWMNSRLHLLSA